MRLIDADALICPIFEGLPEDDFVKGYREGKADAVIDIRTFAPTIDPEELRPKGRWLSAYEYAIKIGVTDAERLKVVAEDKWWKFCNDCGQQVKGFHNYCPKCGAKMIGGEQDAPD